MCHGKFNRTSSYLTKPHSQVMPVSRNHIPKVVVVCWLFYIGQCPVSSLLSVLPLPIPLQVVHIYRSPKASPTFMSDLSNSSSLSVLWHAPAWKAQYSQEHFQMPPLNVSTLQVPPIQKGHATGLTTSDLQCLDFALPSLPLCLGDKFHPPLPIETSGQ